MNGAPGAGPSGVPGAAQRGVPGPSAVPGAATVLGGRYRLARPVGRGGMADVWAADDLLLHRPVAVKLFRVGSPGVDAGRIDAEMRTLAALSHPGIVTIYDAGTTSDPGDGSGGTLGPYLVMELVDGETLAHRIAREPLPPGAAVALAAQLARTLAYLHGRGVVHRDVKPANILLQEPPAGDDAEPFHARLTDFGISRLVGSAGATETGTTVGTANYLAPEQATGGDVGPAADVYALGLVLLEALTGRIAYPGAGMEAVSARLHRPPPLPEGLGPHWTRVLSSMTGLDPALRPTAEDLAAEFAGWPPAGAGATALSNSPGPDDVTAGSAPPLAGSTPGMNWSTAGMNWSTERLAGSTARLPRVVEPAPTRVLATPVPGDRPVRGAGRRRRRRAVTWASAVLAAVVVAVAVVLLMLPRGAAGPSGPDAGPTAATTVHYPSVPGKIGEHLRQLEDAVG